MKCPLCGSFAIGRDYAPPQSLLIFLVLPCILIRYYLKNDPEDLYLTILLTGMVLVAGFVRMNRHGNRYCLRCGVKFRETCKEMGFPQADDKKNAADSEILGDRRAPNNPPRDTPIEPLLKCLRFKNGSMRREAAETLRKVTGQAFGEDADAWEAWWNEKRNKGKREQDES